MDITEAIGHLVDSADDYLSWAENPSAPMHVKLSALTAGLMDMRKRLVELHGRLDGEDLWNE